MCFLCFAAFSAAFVSSLFFVLVLVFREVYDYGKRSLSFWRSFL